MERKEAVEKFQSLSPILLEDVKQRLLSQQKYFLLGDKETRVLLSLAHDFPDFSLECISVLLRLEDPVNACAQVVCQSSIVSGEVVARLQEEGADFGGETEEKKETALHLACKSVPLNQGLLRALKPEGAKLLDRRNFRGRVPLSLLCENPSVQFELLAEILRWENPTTNEKRGGGLSDYTMLELCEKEPVFLASKNDAFDVRMLDLLPVLPNHSPTSLVLAFQRKNPQQEVLDYFFGLQKDKGEPISGFFFC